MDILKDIAIKQTKPATITGSLWDLVMFEATKEEEIVGFIRVSFVRAGKIESENIDDDILAYLKKSTGRGAGIVPRSYDCLDKAGDKMVEDIEYGINELLKGWTYATQQRSLPSTRKDRVANIKQSLPELTKRFDGERQEFMDFHVDKPMVDMVEVKPGHRRKGIGLALYETAAKWAREQGLSLHASRVQTDDARSVWESLLRRGLVEQDVGAAPDKASGLRPRMR